jgi:4-hydroxythreonine-4-phosphate dehydrogenase
MIEKKRPIIAITMGDPAGVGPEVVVKALAKCEIHGACQPVVIGSRDVLSRAVAMLGTAIELAALQSPDDIDPGFPHAYLLDLPPSPAGGFPTNRVDAICGEAAAGYVMRAIELAMQGTVNGIATAPINKAAFELAGVPYRGHTEMLADLTGTASVSMMLVTPGRQVEKQWLRVTHVTTHIPFHDVARVLNEERILDTVSITLHGLRRLGIEAPRLALAALNPHASDDGLMGDEEARILCPAVAAARDQGIDLQGPIPADTVFLRALQGEFDAVIALYHDQGHIPAKTHGFERAVNITLGLPIIRTSVDHGTAFDIAWKGIANEDSMVEAILLASQMAHR